jgi:serine/threonine protein kinase
MMVLEYAKEGSLRNYLDNNFKELNWDDKLLHLYYIASGLADIHKNGLIHQDLHIGNILVSNYTKITDMGLCKPADYNESKNTKNGIYGVLPYIAPEILQGQNYTKAADIYSFGIIMYEVISGLPPYHDVGHDKNLAIKICQGLRPKFNIKVPQLIVHLIKRCLDADPFNRPTTEKVEEILCSWRDNRVEDLQKQIKESEEMNNKLLVCDIRSTNLGISYKTHSEAVYTSRLLSFDKLPEPKNSFNYYEKKDNIISIKSSGIV